MKKEWVQGYCCALSCIVYGHGTGTEIKEALDSAGLNSIKDLRDNGVDEYDIETLRPTINEMKRDKLSTRRPK